MPLDVAQQADLAGVDPARHVGISRRVAAVEADMQRDPGRLAGGDRGFRVARASA